MTKIALITGATSGIGEACAHLFAREHYNLILTGRRSGRLDKLQSVSALPTAYSGPLQAADIHLAPSGKFLYGSIRRHDSIALYSVDENTGLLTYVENHSTHGQTPRNFAIDPTGTFLLAANQDSDNIVSFRIDLESGEFRSTGHSINVGKPVCIKFVR